MCGAEACSSIRNRFFCFFFLLKLDVTHGPVFAGAACLAHENHEELSDFQNEFSWWGYICAAFDPPCVYVLLSNLRKKRG